MNVLITGHSGFIGGHVADYFLERGHVVFGVARALSPDCAYRQYRLEITDCDALARLVNEKCIDTIVHLAGKPIIADCYKDPFGAFMVNSLGTASVLEAARHAGVKKTVVVETDKVYGLQDTVPTKEGAILNPDSPYGLSKVLAAEFCDFYRTYYGMGVISVRPANVFGPGDYSFTRIVPAAMRNIALGVGIPVLEHAAGIHRDFIYVKDVARMMHTLATGSPLHSVYNLSENKSVSILEFANRITEILDVAPPIIVDSPGAHVDIPFQSIDGSQFIAEFGFEFTPFEDAIKETYAAYRAKFNLPVLGR